MGDYRIILADDHAMFRDGIKRMIEKIKDVEIVAEAVDGLELVDLTESVSADMVMVDISMPKLGGIEATRLIKEKRPEVKVLVLTMHRNKEYFYYAMSAGASGYLLKHDAGQELVKAIDIIRTGEIYVSPLLSGELLKDVVNISRGKEKLGPVPLSPREREILVLIAGGKTSREIAEALFLSVRTVEQHRANILKKTKMRNSAELVRFAFQHGFL